MNLQKGLFALFFLSLQFCFAAEPPTSPGEPPPTAEPVAGPRDYRGAARGFALGNFSYADLLIPAKLGVTVGLVSTADKTFEIEYLRSSLSVPILLSDLGKMTDQRLAVVVRSYFGKSSFNLSYGISYFDFMVHLGDKFLNGLTGGSYPSVDLIQYQSLGLNIGVGNRWVLRKNFTIGVDWISWSQPLMTLTKKSAFLDHATNQSDRDAVNAAINLMAYSPRFAAFKVQVGFLF